MYIQYSDVYILRTVDHLHNEISLGGSFRRLVSPGALARSFYDLDVDVAEGCHYIILAPKLKMKFMDSATLRQNATHLRPNSRGQFGHLKGSCCECFTR